MTFSDLRMDPASPAGSILPAICWRCQAWRAQSCRKHRGSYRRSGRAVHSFEVHRTFGEYPRLAAIMFIFAQEERITYGDRLCSLARFPASRGWPSSSGYSCPPARRGPTFSHSYELHLTRAQMGEVDGMSAVHASRMWSELIAEGLISFDNGCVTIEDEQALITFRASATGASTSILRWVP